VPDSKSDLVLDTSVWINLLATGCWQEITAALQCACIAPEHVIDEIKRDPATGKPYARAGDPLYGKVRIEALTEAELDHFIELVSARSGDRLGDGEAASIAIAASRSHMLVIDERKARRIISERWPTMRLMRSSELLTLPAVTSALGPERAAECFQRAIQIARMHV
jgi:predicted nucleic acid-binding protein